VITLESGSLDELAKEFEKRAKRLPNEVRKRVVEATLLVWADARDRANWAGRDDPKPLRPPGPLRAISGMLMRSIARRVEPTETGAKGIVGTALAYARIHELGGEIAMPARSFLGIAKGAKTGRGRKAKRSISRRSFSAHTIKIPARPYLGPALERKRAKALEIIGSATETVHGN